MMCDDCWMPEHDGECPLTTVLPMILPNTVQQMDVAPFVPATARVMLWPSLLTNVFVVLSDEPFDSRKVVSEMKAWIEPFGPDEEME